MSNANVVHTSHPLAFHRACSACSFVETRERNRAPKLLDIAHLRLGERKTFLPKLSTRAVAVSAASVIRDIPPMCQLGSGGDKIAHASYVGRYRNASSGLCLSGSIATVSSADADLTMELPSEEGRRRECKSRFLENHCQPRTHDDNDDDHKLQKSTVVATC